MKSIIKGTNLVKRMECCGSSSETQAGLRMETLMKDVLSTQTLLAPRYRRKRAQSGDKRNKCEIPAPNIQPETDDV